MSVARFYGNGRLCAWRWGEPATSCDCGHEPKHGVKTAWETDEVTGVETLWDYFAWVGWLKAADVMSQGDTRNGAIKATIQAACSMIVVMRAEWPR